MKRFLLPVALLGVLIFLPLATAVARPMTEDFRRCMQDAYREYYDAILDSASTTHDALEQAAEDRRQAYIDSWQIDDDADQRRAERDADRAFRQRSVDMYREQSLRDRELRSVFLDDKRACRDTRRASPSSSSSSSRSAATGCPSWPTCTRAFIPAGCTCSQP